MAVVGRLLPGMMPTARTLITRSARPSSTTTHPGAVPNSETGHSTRFNPRSKHPGGRIPAGAMTPSLSAAGPTKLEP